MSGERGTWGPAALQRPFNADPDTRPQSTWLPAHAIDQHGAHMSQTEETILEGALPLLDEGEQARAALYAAPLGWPQGGVATGNTAGSLLLELLNKRKKQRTLKAAASVGFR